MVKIKVRQPLAEFRVQPSDEADGRAVERFADQIREELNVKKVTLHDGTAPLLSAAARLNKKTAGVQAQGQVERGRGVPRHASMRATWPINFARARSISFGVLLDATDIVIEYKAAAGWAGVAEKGTQVAVDARVTDELAREGAARDIIRHVQDHRKNSGLNMEDRIVLYLDTESEKLQAAIEPTATTSRPRR